MAKTPSISFLRSPVWMKLWGRQSYAAKMLILTAASWITAVLLAECYHALTPWLDTTWRVAASVHSVLSLVVLFVYARYGVLRALWSVDSVADRPFAQRGWRKLNLWLQAAPWRMFLPAAKVILGTAALIVVSRALGDATTRETLSTHLAWVFWVPVVEELVFRAGLGEVLRRYGGFFWGSWFSALTFALIHASPTLENLSLGLVGLPLGPFVLGLACELLFGLCGRILPVIALHAACNATVAMFAVGDERWLQWLDFLYS